MTFSCATAQFCDMLVGPVQSQLDIFRISYVFYAWRIACQTHEFGYGKKGEKKDSHTRVTHVTVTRVKMYSATHVQHMEFNT